MEVNMRSCWVLSFTVTLHCVFIICSYTSEINTVQLQATYSKFKVLNEGHLVEQYNLPVGYVIQVWV